METEEPPAPSEGSESHPMDDETNKLPNDSLSDSKQDINNNDKEQESENKEEKQQPSGNSETAEKQLPSEITEDANDKQQRMSVQEAPAEKEESSAKDIVRNGDTVYYLDNQGYIKYAEVYSNGKLVKIQEFYPASTPESAASNIQFTYELNSVKYIISGTKHDQGTQAVTNRYEYYPSAVYGKHENKVLYKFDVNASGHVTKAEKRKEGTSQILNRYEYYPRTIYGEHGNRIKYKFYLNTSSHVTKAEKRKEGTSQIQIRYEYYPGAIYGKHGNKIKYKFYQNTSGYVTNAEKRKEGTSQIQNRYEYYPQTIYGKHGSRIKYKFYLNANGHVTKAEKREQGTQKIQARYEYYSNALYGQHGKNIKHKFDMDSIGYVSKSVIREQGTQRLLSTYHYKPKTFFGSHKLNISSVRLNVPLVGQLPELPTGCEITSVTMMLQHRGAKVDKVALANEMPRHSSDPNYGYVGNPFTTRGWTVYPPALMKLVGKYAGNAQNLTGVSNLKLESELANNKPVMVWVSPMHGFTVHAITLTGYDQSNYYFNDPWTNKKDIKMGKSEFIKLWSNQSKRAISY
jgi:uncharacterized protein YvpB